MQDVEAPQGKIVEQFPEDVGQRFLSDFSGRQQGNTLFSQFLRRWRPVVRLTGAKLGLEGGIGWVGTGGFGLGGSDFAIDPGKAERIGFVVFRRIVVARQPAGVGFERNRRHWEKAVAIIGRVLVRQENKLGIGGMPKCLVGLISIVAQIDFFVRHSAGVEIGRAHV